ncbi:MAG: HEAT repeat domain-containing protein [Deltaproteobacteria bacterium]|nr:HEAT repeat domain-containing protein [Deltaproteobacteria bacterium]
MKCRTPPDNERYVRWGAADVIGEVFSLIPDKKQAWEDLIRLTSDNYSSVVASALKALSSTFASVPDKKQACGDLHRLTSDSDSYVRMSVVYMLISKFSHLSDKKQACEDLISLTSDKAGSVRKAAAYALGNVFSHVPDKKQAWEDLIRLTSDKEKDVRRGAADALVKVFSYVPDKKQAWEDLHWLTSDSDSYVRWRATDVIGKVFSHVPDKKQAWEDLIRLTSAKDKDVRRGAADALGSAFASVPDKKQACEDLHRLTSAKDKDVRRGAADALGSAFASVLDKKQACEDLHRLTFDTDSYVRASAYHSLGKASIFKAANAENDIDLKKEMEAAIGYFEKSSQQTEKSKPSKFCLPLYRSFYALTFRKEETEAEVKKYIKEAKSAVEGSESKEKLLEAVENLGNALKEAQKVRDFNDLKSDLNAYRRYCDRACELLDTMEEKSPGASRLIRMGLPIIDDRIKGIIAEIQETAKAACQQSKGTPTEDIACAANREIQKWRIDDQEGMTWAVENLIFSLSSKIPHIPKNKHIHDKIEKIRNERDVIKQYIMIANLVALIPSVSVDTLICNSTIGQVGNGHVDINLDKNQKLT